LKKNTKTGKNFVQSYCENTILNSACEKDFNSWIAFAAYEIAYISTYKSGIKRINQPKLEGDHY